MELSNSISEELWGTIEKNFKNRNYTCAILDAMHFLTETIRNKSGLDIEGTKLAVKAFGGDMPKIRVNNLQTALQKDAQRGTEEIIKGLYMAVKNSRSYDKEVDTKEECTAIIIFINYLLNIIDESKLSFEEETFLKRVFDDYYVKSKEYSNLLVSEIPKTERVNIAISVLLKREEGDIYNLSYFMNSLMEKLNNDEIDRVYSVVSEELKYTSDEKDIRTILNICPGKHWRYMDKAVKMRIENILLSSMKIGRYNKTADRCIGDAGALGTWVDKQYLENFENIDEWTKTAVMKLAEGTCEEKDYIDAYFWENICNLNRENINSYLRDYISQGLTNGYGDVAKRVFNIIEKDENHPWKKVFEKELKAYDKNEREKEEEELQI